MLNPSRGMQNYVPTRSRNLVGPLHKSVSCPVMLVEYGNLQGNVHCLFQPEAHVLVHVLLRSL